MIRGTILLVFCLGGAVALAQQPSARPTSLAVTGRALAAADNAALRRARVDVTAGNQRFGSVFTDDAGGFMVEVFGAGPFVVTVTKGGYASARATLSRGELANPLSVRLPRSGAVGGTIVDQNGVPLMGAFVTAARVDDDAEGFPKFFSTTADDLGAYRFSGLVAGRYEIAAGPSGTGMTVLTTTAGVVTTTLVSGIGRPVGGTTIETARQRSLVPMVIVTGADGSPVSLPAPPLPAPRTVSLRPSDELLDVNFTVEIFDAVSRRAEVDRLLVEKGQSVRRDADSSLPPGRSGIRGRVTTESGQPLVEAGVQVIGSNGMPAQTRTREDGTYSIRGIPPGSYTLQVSKSGFATVTWGQRGAQQAGRLITVAADQIVEGVNFIARRGDAISGVVVDEHGEPLQGASVQALQIRDAGGRLVTVPVSQARRTDDRGQYRLSGLLPGTYLIAASVDVTVVGPSGATSAGYAPIYYPGTPLIDVAGQIALNGDMPGANLVFTPSRSARVRGIALDAEGPLVSGTARLLTSRRTRAIALDIPPATLGSDGSFFFAHVPPGEYAVQVRGDGPGRTGMFGVEHVSVGDRDPAVVTVRTSRGATLEGRFVIEGELDTPLCMSAIVDGANVMRPCAPNSVRAATFTVVPVSLDPDRARPDGPGLVVSSEGSFYATSLSGEIGFTMRRAPSDSWFLKSVTIAGLDVTDTGYDFGTGPRTVENGEIVVSRRGATITGRVRDGDVPAAEYAVVVFPTLRDQWGPYSRRLRFVPPSHDGSFRVAGLPPGDYYVAAVNRLEGTSESGEWQSPDVLSRLVAGAERITIREGESHVATLRLLRR